MMQAASNSEEQNTTRAEQAVHFSVQETMKTLSPAFADLSKDRLSAETRSYQDRAALLSGLGIALILGLINFTKLDQFGIAISASGASAVLLLLFASIYFLFRFMFMSSRDETNYRLIAFAASFTIDSVAQRRLGVARELHERSKLIEKSIADGSSAQGELSKLHEQNRRDVQSFEQVSNVIEPIVARFLKRSNFADNFVAWYERGLPCVLVAILFFLVTYAFINDASFRDLLVHPISNKVLKCKCGPYGGLAERNPPFCRLETADYAFG